MATLTYAAYLLRSLVLQLLPRGEMVLMITLIIITMIHIHHTTAVTLYVAFIHEHQVFGVWHQYGVRNKRTAVKGSVPGESTRYSNGVHPVHHVVIRPHVHMSHTAIEFG